MKRWNSYRTFLYAIFYLLIPSWFRVQRYDCLRTQQWIIRILFMKAVFSWFISSDIVRGHTRNPIIASSPVLSRRPTVPVTYLTTDSVLSEHLLWCADIRIIIQNGQSWWIKSNLGKRIRKICICQLVFSSYLCSIKQEASGLIWQYHYEKNTNPIDPDGHCMAHGDNP